MNPVNPYVQVIPQCKFATQLPNCHCFKIPFILGNLPAEPAPPEILENNPAAPAAVQGAGMCINFDF